MTGPQAVLDCSAHNSYQQRRAKEHECACNCRREGEDDAEHAHLEPCHGPPLAEDDQGHTGAGCCHSGQRDRIGRTSPRIICQAAVSATWRY